MTIRTKNLILTLASATELEILAALPQNKAFSFLILPPCERAWKVKLATLFSFGARKNCLLFDNNLFSLVLGATTKPSMILKHAKNTLMKTLLSQNFCRADSSEWGIC